MVDASDSAVRELAGKILARPEYAEVHNTVPSWVLSWFRWFFVWISKFKLMHTNAPGLYWLIVAAMFAVFALLVAHIVWTVSIAMRASQLAEPSAANPEKRDPEADAAQLAASGSYLEAAHHLMIATFRTLAERSVIELRPDRSNRWIRLAVRRSKLNDSLALRIDDLIGRTERHWFGDRENSPAIYSQWQSTYQELSRLAR